MIMTTADLETTARQLAYRWVNRRANAEEAARWDWLDVKQWHPISEDAAAMIVALALAEDYGFEDDDVFANWDMDPAPVVLDAVRFSKRQIDRHLACGHNPIDHLEQPCIFGGRIVICGACGMQL